MMRFLAATEKSCLLPGYHGETKNMSAHKWEAGQTDLWVTVIWAASGLRGYRHAYEHEAESRMLMGRKTQPQLRSRYSGKYSSSRKITVKTISLKGCVHRKRRLLDQRSEHLAHELTALLPTVDLMLCQHTSPPVNTKLSALPLFLGRRLGKCET